MGGINFFNIIIDLVAYSGFFMHILRPFYCHGVGTACYESLPLHFELDPAAHKAVLRRASSLFGAMLQDWLQWAPGDGRGSTCFATLEGLKEALNNAGFGRLLRMT